MRTIGTDRAYGMSPVGCVTIRSVVSRAILVLLAQLVLCGLAPQREADKDTTAIIQASYIYNIAKLVEWKDPAMRQGNFVIGVIGGTNLYQELIKKYANKTIGQQPIEVRKLPRTAQVEPCHVLFVGMSELGLMADIYKNLMNRNTLLVTEYPGALEDGAVVNFLKVDNTLRYELSINNARKHRLEVGSTLKQLAQRVEE
ncbi:MAG: YfiR family protein [Flavobacteriales bacterium]|nr:YfiR family protein [Flavobacteriales bacterium]